VEEPIWRLQQMQIERVCMQVGSLDLGVAGPM